MADEPKPIIPADLAPAGASATASDAPLGDAPYFTSEDGTEYKTEQDFLKFAREKMGPGALTPEQVKALGGDDTTTAPAGEATEAKPGEDSLQAASGNDTVAAALTDDQIIAELNKQPEGTIYRDPNYQPFAVAFEKAGDLTPEQRADAATKLNIPRPFVDAFVDAQKQARAVVAQGQSSEAVAAAVADLETSVGGHDAFVQLNDWAQKTLKPTEIAAFNAAPHDAKRVMLAGFKAQYAASGDAPGPRDVAREGARVDAAAAGSTAYGSEAEWQSDMAKPQYRQDAAYRAKVEQRLRATDAPWARG